MRYTRACLSYLADGAQMGFVRRPLCSNSNSNSSNNISFSSISSARRSSPGSSPLSSLQRPSTTITTITTRQWQVASATDTRLRQVPNHCAFTAGGTCVWQRCAAGDTHLAASAAAASYVLSRTAPTVHPGAKAVDQTSHTTVPHTMLFYDTARVQGVAVSYPPPHPSGGYDWRSQYEYPPQPEQYGYPIAQQLPPHIYSARASTDLPGQLQRMPNEQWWSPKVVGARQVMTETIVKMHLAGCKNREVSTVIARQRNSA